MSQNKVSVYDLPMRIFHILFGLTFVSAFGIAKFVDDESLLFTYHMLIGMVMVVMVLMRIIWGFVGSKYARFQSFRLNPKELIEYMKAVFAGGAKRVYGHNVASSYAAIVMFICSLGLGTSGILMSLRINKHFFEEIHEVLSHLFLVAVIAHIAGVVFHHLLHQDGLLMSMFNGKKNEIEGEVTSQIINNRPFIAILFIVLTLSSSFYINSQYNTSTQTIQLLGKQIRLGEAEEHGEKGERGEAREDHDEHDD